jgi:signal transduction histidine kinase/CheY-like chemotaxis protein
MKPSENRLRLLYLLQGGGFTVILLALLTMAWHYQKESLISLAMTTARTSAEKDLLYRQLLVEKGGAYMSINKVFPDQSIKRPDRDIVKADGDVLTLITPKRFLKLIAKADSKNQCFQSSIKAFLPLGPEDTPDEWEKESMLAIKAGKDEVGEIFRDKGEIFFRYMRPAYATGGCVRNRPGKGLDAGDLLGGISLKVPLHDLNEYVYGHWRVFVFFVGLLWIMGIGGLFISFKNLVRRDRQLQDAMEEQKKSAEEIRSAKEELQKTFDTISDVITVQDTNMMIVNVNKAASEILGSSPKELIGKKCHEIFRGISVPCEGCPEVVTLRDDLIHNALIEHENLGKIFDVSAAPIKDDQGRTIGIVHCAKDITETKQLESQLRQSQKMEAIGTLAGGIAHDFNNILSAIMGYGELARLKLQKGSEKEIQSKEIQSDVEQILSAAHRASELVKQILTFSRKKEQKLQPLQVHLVVKEVIKLLQTTIPSSVNIRQDIDDTCGLVIADPSQVHQVVLNLCTNAYHALKETGGYLNISLLPVEIDSREQMKELHLQAGRYVCLSVKDSGPGIDEKIINRIFEPYFTTKVKGEGTGLGLSVVHGIVKGLGGNIIAENSSEKGAVFSAYFPVHIGDEFLDDAQVEEEDIPGGTESVLVVDDKENIAIMLERVLQNLGYSVDSFSDSEQALAAFGRHPEKYDLIITDMDIPYISGSQLAHSVHEVRSKLPIIICTGLSGKLTKQKVEEIGAHLLFKPVRIAELARTVRHAIEEC